MKTRKFREMLEYQWSFGKFVCVGLDPLYMKLPESIQWVMAPGLGRLVQREPWKAILKFNRAIIEATADLVCAFKLNAAFYESMGERGIELLQKTVRLAHEVAPEVVVIYDAKRADIGHSNKGYVYTAFDLLDADAITVHPYLGAEALQPFLDLGDKGVIVLCRTSNPGAGEFQDWDISGDVVPDPGYMPLYKYVAYRVANDWNKNGNCAVVAGATYPGQLREIREVVHDLPILIPGVGAQGGDVRLTVEAGRRKDGKGMIINSSRGIIYASSGEDFAKAACRQAEELHRQINEYRSE